MNPLIETLNRFGEYALHFAWPMWWQSSALIAMLFAADFALRRHVRAAVRHALWLVVLIKLVLPPSLALPTGLAWWLLPSATAPGKPPATNFTVSYGPDTALAPPSPAAVALTPPPRLPLSAAAWMVVGWLAIGLGLLGWLTTRWRRVARDVRRARPAPDWLNQLFDEARRLAGLRQAVCLRVTDQVMSPAVCGLFRPVILLPQALAAQLPPAQLRAVLLHELTHLRRGDVWVNCAQALVQIAYWWHPLLWFANARIRRVREEAVDDAVMLTLRDDAEVYAPTLLEVAKLAFHRPLASLGLVGILESRSALRHRIERLMDFRAPRKAELTFLSVLGVLVFSALAVPMGEAPAKTSEPVVPSGQADAGTSQKGKAPDPIIAEPSSTSSRTIIDEASPPTVQTGNPTSFFLASSARRIIYDKLNRIHLNAVSWPDGLPLSEALHVLSMQARLCDPDKKGINFLFDSNSPAASLPSSAAAEALDPSSVNVRLMLTNVTFAEVLEAIILTADHPIKYSIEDDAVVFSAHGPASTQLETRTFKFETNVFPANLQRQTGPQTNISLAFKQFIIQTGVDLSPPKSIYFNETRGILFIRATKQDLDTVEKAILEFNFKQLSVPQIHIKARFIEVPETVLLALNTSLASSNGTNHAGWTGIMMPGPLGTFLRSLESRPDVKFLAEPEVTTLSDRQTQMRAMETVSVMDGINPRALTSPGVLNTDSPTGMKTAQVETGPVFDVIPHLLSDGCTLRLDVTAIVTEFMGYDERGKTNLATIYVDGRQKQVNVPMPRFITRELTTTVAIHDGQTVVLGGGISRQITTTMETVPVTGDVPAGEPRLREQTTRTVGEKKQLLVLITATLVDAAGNRIHNDADILIGPNGIPPQDSR